MGTLLKDAEKHDYSFDSFLVFHINSCLAQFTVHRGSNSLFTWQIKQIESHSTSQGGNKGMSINAAAATKQTLHGNLGKKSICKPSYSFSFLCLCLFVRYVLQLNVFNSVDSWLWCCGIFASSFYLFGHLIRLNGIMLSGLYMDLVIVFPHTMPCTPCPNSIFLFTACTSNLGDLWYITRVCPLWMDSTTSPPLGAFSFEGIVLSFLVKRV